MINWINSIFSSNFIILGEGYFVLGDFYFSFPTELPQFTPLSIFFICFIFIVFCLSRPFRGKIRAFVLLIADFLFLFSFASYHLLFLLCLSLIGWILSLINQKYKNKKLALISSIIIVFVLLIFKFPQLFKYNLLMPLGISFVSFKIISTIVDAYKGEIDVKNPLYYFNYTLFFPTIIAGPINRFASFKETLSIEQEFNYKDAKNGAFQMMLGIFEKIVFCDFIASVVTRASAEGLLGTNALLAIVLYSFQIYLDFDAYSNISIGCARLLGFSFSKNFNSPYLASSIKEFWRRWHISLGTFFRDYVYIPLGGNREGKLRQYLAIIVVFALSGIWHGSTINFLLWGLAHALLQIIEEEVFACFRKHKFNNTTKYVLRTVGVIFNFFVVTVLWQLFKYNDISQLNNVWNTLCTPAELNFELIGLTHNEVIWLIVIILITVLFDILRDKWDMLEVYSRFPFPIRWMGYIVLICVFLIFGVYGGSFEASDFIYQWF